MDQATNHSKKTSQKTSPSGFSARPRRSIRRRMMAVTLSLILITIAAITTVAVLSASNVSRRAQEISSQSLREQAEIYLAQITSSSARENDLILERANRDVMSVAEAVAAIYEKFGERSDQVADFYYGAYWPFDENMFMVADGQYMNGKQDLTTVLVPDFQEINQGVRRDVELGAYLEPTMRGVFENNPNVEAIYFATPNEVTRYYPNIGLGELVPPDFKVTGRVWYSESVSANQDKSRIDTVWTAPYLDATGLGMVTTVAVPVYDPSQTLLGVVGMDLTLNEVSSNIQTTKILQSGYSFLIDKDGKAIILPDEGYLDMLGRPREPEEFGTDLRFETVDAAPGFAVIIDQMTLGESGFSSVSVNGSELFVAFASMPSTGWSLGSVVKAEDVLQSVSLLQQDLQSANLSLLLNQVLPVVLVISVILVILSLVWTNRLVNPIQELAEAAQNIGPGQWQTSVPVQSNDEIGLLAHTLNSMTRQLRITFEGLEQRVAERTQQLEHRSMQLQTAAEVARDITLSTDLDELLDRAVTLIKERFDFYSVSLFLSDESGTYAHLAAASGEASNELLENGVRLRVGLEGIVGYVISSGAPRVVSDVSTDSTYLEYPLLPDTRSEIALPLRVGRGTIGALDVQSARVEDFEQEQMTVLQTLADQLAIAIENIRLVERLQATLQETQSFYQRQVEQAWQSAALEGAIAYEFDQLKVKPVAGTSLPDNSQEKAQLVLPVKLRDQVIGYIGLESNDPSHEWTKDEIAIVEATANQAALTLENARLLAETQRRAEREQMMGQIAARVRETLDLDMVLKTTLRSIGQAMNIDVAEIRLRAENSIEVNPNGNKEDIDG